MKKQISGGVFLSFFSQAISIIVGLAYTPIMIRILGQSEYGLYQLVLSVVNYLNLMNFGFNGAYIRYFSIAKAKNDEKEIANINGMFMKIFMLIALLCLFGGVFLFFNIHILGTHITEAEYIIAKKLLVLMVVNLALSFPNSLFVAYLSANERFIFQKLTNIIINILIPALNLPILLLGFGSIGIVMVTLALTVVRLVVNIWYCIKKLDMKINLNYFNKGVFKGLLGYTFFIFLSDLVDQLNSNVDKLLLGRMAGTVAVAIYSTGFSLKNYYTIVSWIVPEMYVPETNRIAIEENNDRKLTEIFTRIGRYNNYLVLLVLTGFILIGKQFINLWVGSEYELSYYVTVILMLAGYIPAVQTLGVNIQNAKNMHRMRSIVYFVVGCVNVISSIFLIKVWGVIGTCLGTFFSVFLGHGLFMNYYYHKYLNLNIFFFWKEMFKWILPIGILFGIACLALAFVSINSWLSLGVFAFLYGGAYIILLFFMGLNKEERMKIKGKIKR